MILNRHRFLQILRKKRKLFSPLRIYATTNKIPDSVHNLKQNKERFNAINIQMLSPGLHEQIFAKAQCSDVEQKTVNSVLAHMKKHDIQVTDTSVLSDVDFPLPKLLGSDISLHFKNMAEELTTGYKNLLSKLTNCQLPPIPSQWSFKSGWTRYNSDGSTTSVPFPGDEAIVFDVEVCVQEGNYPTLAAAASENHWYLWCSERLVENNFTWSQGVYLSDLIPLGTKTKSSNSGYLVVGHNVAFDRSFIKEQYLLEGDNCYFIDTMSLHMCVSGLTGLQRAMSIASKKEMSDQENVEFPGMPCTWADISSLNNLADVYNLYCDGPVLEKSERELFVTGSMVEIREKFQELATYCSHDVQATHEVLKKIVPMFFERFPHPVTFAGLLEMSSVYLPINQNWERYLRDTQDTYDDLQKELKLSLMHLANDACSLLHREMYKNDPWLWDLNWSVQKVKFRKLPSPTSGKKKITKAKSEKNDSIKVIKHNEENLDVELAVESENVSAVIQDQTMKQIYESAASLRKVRPFLPGYPAWYRELCDKNKVGKSDWEPGPSLISSQMRCVPKLMRLTWDGYPLHYDSKHGWGYLVPNEEENCFLDNQDFPLQQFLALSPGSERSKVSPLNNAEDYWSLIKEPKESITEETRLWKAILGEFDAPNKCSRASAEGPENYGVGPYDVGIGGCSFYRLPHKDGPHKRVGNPLSKDFLPKVEDGTLRSWGEGQADRALVLSKMLSYWKNSHQRIVSQMVVWLNKDGLPSALTSHENFDETSSYGAILPRLIPAGTVTRRAVEPTWLTASNAYSDRVGSELKSMVQAPPGYHFIGADVDSQELWIAAILGDSHFAKLHGCTAFGWMTLQGKKSAGTDMHSRTAKSVGVSRSQAKILNYARIYGAGKPFAQRLLMQFNHRLSVTEAKMKVKKIYAETKGTRRFGSSEKQDEDDENLEVFTSRKIWSGGSESHLFNKLEEIAISAAPKTPVLECRISRALEPKAVDTNFMTSRINWVVQSSAVDYLHLMLVSMKWLFKHYEIDGRLSICIHDEVRFLVNSKDRYRAALALQITNLWTRSLFAFKLGMNDLPQSVAFFASVDIDKTLRKEVDMDSVTPSNPHGLQKGYGIPPGEALDIYQVLEKTGGSLLSES